MGEESQRDVLRMEYVYKEYVRLHEVANAYAHSSFDDFKLLAAVGLILTWAPFGSLFTGETASPEVLFLGFVAILLIIAIISTRDFLKQSLIIHYQRELQPYDQELRSLLGQTGLDTFRGGEYWHAWFVSHHKRVALAFYCLFSLATVVFPACVLAWRASWRWALAYLIVVCLISCCTMSAMVALYGWRAVRNMAPRFFQSILKWARRIRN